MLLLRDVDLSVLSPFIEVYSNATGWSQNLNKYWITTVSSINDSMVQLLWTDKMFRTFPALGSSIWSLQARKMSFSG